MELRTKVSEGPDVWMLNSVRVMPVVLGKVTTSQELKWLRICLPIRGHGFNPWSGLIPHASSQLSLCATA